MSRRRRDAAGCRSGGSCRSTSSPRNQAVTTGDEAGACTQEDQPPGTPRDRPHPQEGRHAQRQRRRAPSRASRAPRPPPAAAAARRSSSSSRRPRRRRSTSTSGRNYKVLASYGHVRDLPRRRKKGEEVAGIDIDDGWMPTYVVVEREEGKTQGPAHRQGHPRRAEAARPTRPTSVYLATDPDREGEAIAWHIEEALNLDDADTFRITFNEITKTAVQQALAEPRQDQHGPRPGPGGPPHPRPRRRLPAQSTCWARRWRAARRRPGAVGGACGWSWTASARSRRSSRRNTGRSSPMLAPQGHASACRRKPLEDRPRRRRARPRPRRRGGRADGEGGEARRRPRRRSSPEGTFLAELVEWDGKKCRRPTRRELTTRPTPSPSRSCSTRRRYVVTQDRAEGPQRAGRRRRSPPARCSSRRASGCTSPAQRTMQTAQKLYEGVDLGSEGQVALITYMRTDSTRVSNDALTGGARPHPGDVRRPTYLPDEAELLRLGQERPGGPRGDPADRRDVHAGAGRAAGPARRPAAAVHADLQPLRRQPDDAGRLRRHQRGGRRRRRRRADRGCSRPAARC